MESTGHTYYIKLRKEKKIKSRIIPKEAWNSLHIWLSNLLLGNRSKKIILKWSQRFMHKKLSQNHLIKKVGSLLEDPNGWLAEKLYWPQSEKNTKKKQGWLVERNCQWWKDKTEQIWWGHKERGQKNQPFWAHGQSLLHLHTAPREDLHNT